MEDIHAWTSLAHHYLAFMGGSDAQQVAYTVTLLHVSGIWGTKEGAVIRPEIGHSCVMHSSSDSDPTSDHKRLRAH